MASRTRLSSLLRACFLVTMNFAILPRLCLSASRGPRTYWNSTLPGTPIPRALLSFLNTGVRNPFYVDGKAIHPMGCSFGYTCTFTYERGASFGPSERVADPNSADFVLEKDLRVGTKADLHFYGSSATTGGFLPRPVAESVPFSSRMLPELMRRFHVEPKSAAADVMEDTLQACEAPALPGEEKLCATSLESMVDFATSALGTRDVRVTSTTAVTKTPGNFKQRYTVTPPGAKQLAGRESVVCHPFGFPYAVFFCHKLERTKVYATPLAGEDGVRVRAVVICHEDTSGWNPRHISFTVLHVKPGTVPVCHFLPEDHVVWTPSE